MKRVWLKTFYETGLFNEESAEIELISKGMKKSRCLNQSFAPSCGEFIALCKEE